MSESNEQRNLELQEKLKEDATEDVEILKKRNQDLKAFASKIIEVVREKTTENTRLEKQNVAFSQQVNSLKDVVAITKNLLDIRNLEVEQLRAELLSVHSKIAEERQRHSTMLENITSANRISEDIKEEYKSQMELFQQLREKYHEKIALITNENKKLQDEINSLKNLPEIQTENTVDKN